MFLQPPHPFHSSLVYAIRFHHHSRMPTIVEKEWVLVVSCTEKPCRVPTKCHITMIVVCNVNLDFSCLYILCYLSYSDTSAQIDHIIVFPKKEIVVCYVYMTCESHPLCQKWILLEIVPTCDCQ